MAGESTIAEFLTRLGDDPEFAELFYDDPGKARDQTDLPDEKWEIIISGDLRRLQTAVFDEQPEGRFVVEFKPIKIWPERPIKASG
jgi:hypothetical protein